MNRKRFHAPQITPDFADYLVQRIMKKSRPLYHIIHIFKPKYRRDLDNNPIQFFESSIKERNFIQVTCSSEFPNDINIPPKEHIILFCHNIETNEIPIDNIGIIHDKFQYNIRHSIIKKLVDQDLCNNEELEIYTNLKIGIEKKPKKPTKPIENNDAPRPEKIYKAFKKHNTIIFELVKLFKENEFQTISLQTILKAIPTCKIYNYTQWNKKHAQYNLLYKTTNKGYNMHTEFIQTFSKQ